MHIAVLRAGLSPLSLEQHWLQQKHHLQLEALVIGVPGHENPADLFCL